MRILWSVFLVAAIIGGCSSDGLLKTEEKVTGDLTPEDVLRVIDSAGLNEETPSWIIDNIGAQLLEAKYRSFNDGGLSESDFGRMPDNDLTDNVRQLYLDL